MRYRFLLLILVVVMVFTGCQPTPDEIIVKTKAGEALEESIQKSNSEISVTAIPDDENVEIVAQYALSESHIQHNAINQRGNISLNIDATVYQPSVNNIPVATVELDRFTQDQLDNLVTTLVGKAKLTDVNIITKSKIEELIIRVKRDENNLHSDLAQSNGIKTIAELNNYAKQEIERLESLYKDAVDDESECSIDYIDASTDSISLYAYNNKNTLAEIDYFNHDSSVGFSYRNFCDNNEPRMFTDLSGRPHGILCNNEETYDIGISYQDAKKVALNTLSEMNISNMIMPDTFITYEPSREIMSGTKISSSKGLKYYVFCFKRIIQNVIIDNSYNSASDSSNDIDMSYSKSLGHESLKMWIDSTGVVQFDWNSPLLVSDILNDSVELLVDLENAVSTMETQVFIKYADMYGNIADNLVIDVDKITLSLARIRYKGHTGQYIVVPVWEFYGDVIISSDKKLPVDLNIRTTKNDNEYTINNPYNSIITINALDGTIINREIGY